MITPVTSLPANGVTTGAVATTTGQARIYASTKAGDSGVSLRVIQMLENGDWAKTPTVIKLAGGDAQVVDFNVLDVGILLHVMVEGGNVPSSLIIALKSAQSTFTAPQGLVTTDIDVWVGPSGNDNNPGTILLPFATIERATQMASMHMGHYNIHLMPGVVPITSKAVYASIPYGPSAVPVALIGGFSNIYGTRISDTSDNSGPGGTFLNDATMTGVRSTATASIVAGAASGKVRILVGGYTAADIGSGVLTSGAASAGNNSDWNQIFAVNPGISIDVINAQGIAGDANNGAITVQDSLVGGFLECMTGANAGQRRMIRSNTTTRFVANTPFPSAITSGDTFNIERPNITLQYSAPLDLYGSTIGMVGVKFQCTAVGVTVFALNVDNVVTEGCEFDLSGSDGLGRALNIIRTSYSTGNMSVQQLRDWQNDTSGIFSIARNGSGTFVHNAQNFLPQQGGQITGFFVLRSIQSLNFTNQGVGGAAAAVNSLQSLDAQRVTCSVQNGSVLILAAAVATYPSVWNGQYTNSASLGAMTFQNNSSGSLTGIGINNSGGDGILVQSGSSVSCDKLTGTGNSGAGIHVDRHGYVQIDSGGANDTTITGTAGDTKFGHPTVANIQTYATIRTADGNGVKGYQDTYLNRIEP